MTERPGQYDAPRRAVEQATEVIGRLLRAFEVPPASDPLAVGEPAPDGDTTTFAQLRSSVSRAVDLYLDLFQRTFDVYVDTTERALRRRGLTAAGAQGDDSLVLVADRGAGTAAGTLYLHNFSGGPVGPVDVLVTDLTAHDGSVVASGAITVEPNPTGSLDDGATAALQVRADIATVPAGTYHGHALLDDGALAVRLEVPGTVSTGTGTATADVTATLERYGCLTAGAIEEFLDRLGRTAPELARLVADYPSRGGKAIRPSLLIATCRAFGGSVRDAMGPAVSLEMLHNAFLIHDDVEDASELRRGRSTLHRLHGVPLAVHAGDALAMLALQPLRDTNVLGSRLQERVVTEYLAMSQRTVEGQARELQWRRDNVVDVTPEDYLELIGSKTCWYTTIYPLRVGALVGSRGTATLEPLSRFGYFLGAAFQIRDDLLDVVGTTAETGKEPLGDLREGKRTLMLLHLFHHAAPPQREWLRQCLAADDRDAADVEAIAALMRSNGSIDFTIAYARDLAAAARQSFEAAFDDVPDSPHREFLRAMVDYMVERTG